MLKIITEQALRQHPKAKMFMENDAYYWKVPAIWLHKDIEESKIKAEKLHKFLVKDEDNP